MTTQPVRDITTEEFPEAVLQRSREVPVVVDFWAEWCGPCKILGPLLEEAAAAAHGTFELVKVDVDANQELSAQFAIQSFSSDPASSPHLNKTRSGWGGRSSGT